MTEMTRGIKMLAALLGEKGDGQNIIDATKNMMIAFQDLLDDATPKGEENRHELVAAANRLAKAQSALLLTLGSTGYM